MTETTAEEWRPIDGHENYEVSSLGHVRSLDRYAVHGSSLRFRRGCVLSESPGGKRYYYINLTLKKGVAIHVLACTAFHGPKPGPGYQVAHANGDSFDNRAANLRWATASENNRDKLLHGTLVTPSGVKLTWTQVRAIRAEWDSGGVKQADLCRRYAMRPGMMSRIVRRKSWVELESTS